MRPQQTDLPPAHGQLAAAVEVAVSVSREEERHRMFALVVRFDLKPGREAEFDDLVTDTLIGIDQGEPGTLMYATHRVRSEPRARVFYEVYRDRAAFDAHEATAHTASFLAKRQQYLAQPPRVEFLSDLGGKGVTKNRD